MVFVGSGFAFCMVSSFGRAHFAAITKGFNDDMDTYIFVSGKTIFAFFLPFSIFFYFKFPIFQECGLLWFF